MKRKIRSGLIYLLGVMFLLNSLMPGFSEQMNKMPSLVNHYFHHLEEHDEHLSFAAFLVEHYGENSSHKTAEDHSDLPLFQFTSHCMIALVNDIFPFELHKPYPALVQHHTIYRSTYHFKASRSIFQPPKA